jgi:hypothetical protein
MNTRDFVNGGIEPVDARSILVSRPGITAEWPEEIRPRAPNTARRVHR